MPDLASKDIQFCKRVTYLDTVWVLMAQGKRYLWVSQDRIPRSGYSSLPPLDPLQGALQRRLEELQAEREHLARQPSLSVGTPRSEDWKASLEMEALRAELQDLKLSNATLQQLVLSSKAKVRHTLLTANHRPRSSRS